MAPFEDSVNNLYVAEISVKQSPGFIGALELVQLPCVTGEKVSSSYFVVDGVGDGCEKAESLADHRDAGHPKELTSGSEPGGFRE